MFLYLLKNKFSQTLPFLHGIKYFYSYHQWKEQLFLYLGAPVIAL
jgi:hypothetical protein